MTSAQRYVVQHRSAATCGAWLPYMTPFNTLHEATEKLREARNGTRRDGARIGYRIRTAPTA